MRKITSLLLILALVVVCVFSFASCAGHSHTYGGEWTYDANNHWHAATCEHTDAQGDLAAHTYDSDYKCTVCGYTHTHGYESAWSFDENNHWKNTSCGHTEVKGELAAHDYNSDGLCVTCGYYPNVQEGAHKHTFAKAWTTDPTGHWHASTCGHGVKADFAQHQYRVFGADTYLCEVCNYRHTHTYSADWSADSTGHWHADLCGHDKTSGFEAHTYVDGICSVCGYYDKAEHTLEEEWSMDDTGHWYACTCGHGFRFDHAAHTYDGNFVCTVCGYEHDHKTQSTAYDFDFGGHWHVVTCGHDVKPDYEAHDYVNGICSVCKYDISTLSSDELAAVAVIYSHSNPTKMTTDSSQEFGGIILNGKSILTVTQIFGKDVAVYERIQDELRSVEAGGKDEFIKGEIVTSHTITQYYEGLGVREVDPNGNTAGEWNPDGEFNIPSKSNGGIALDLKLGYIENLTWENGVLTCTVPAAFTKNVFGTDTGADVSLTIKTSDGYIREVVLQYVVPANEDSNLVDTAVNVTVMYEYDEQMITID